MKTIRFNNTFECIQNMCPINNATIPIEWDKAAKELIITTASGTMVVKDGESVLFDEQGNALCHLVNATKKYGKRK